MYSTELTRVPTPLEWGQEAGICSVNDIKQIDLFKVHLQTPRQFLFQSKIETSTRSASNEGIEEFIKKYDFKMENAGDSGQVGSGVQDVSCQTAHIALCYDFHPRSCTWGGESRNRPRSNCFKLRKGLVYLLLIWICICFFLSLHHSVNYPLSPAQDSW